MDSIKTLLEQQPLMALFLTIAIGYFLGETKLGGFSLGVGAVLFVALGMGWAVPKAVPAPMVGTLGLTLFLYSVGVQYGSQFFIGLTSRAGLRANLLALTGVLASGAVSLAIKSLMDMDLSHALGLFAGAGTSTAALQAAIASLGSDDAAIGYSVAYPFGVAGPIIVLFIASALLKPVFASRSGTGAATLEIALRNPALSGRLLSEVATRLPASVQVVAYRRQGHNVPASPELVLAENDVVLAVAANEEEMERAREILGEAAPGQLVEDRADLDYLRVFLSRSALAGKTLGELSLPAKKAALVVEVQRGDSHIVARPELMLEVGDRLGVLAHRGDFQGLRQYFGDSIKGTAEFSYISVGVGMACGLLLGALQLPIPGVGKLSLGLAGVLIVALVLGKLRRTGRRSWTLPLSANLVLRNLGLTVFLAQVGMASGPKFAATVADTGFSMLGLGAIVLLAIALPILVLGLYVFRMPFDEMAGIVAGACGNPAIVAYANDISQTERPDVAYAMIFPSMTIVKILFVDVVAALS
jgi:putative transport protein